MKRNSEVLAFLEKRLDTLGEQRPGNPWHNGLVNGYSQAWSAGYAQRDKPRTETYDAINSLGGVAETLFDRGYVKAITATLNFMEGKSDVC